MGREFKNRLGHTVAYWNSAGEPFTFAAPIEDISAFIEWLREGPPEPPQEEWLSELTRLEEVVSKAIAFISLRRVRTYSGWDNGDVIEDLQKLSVHLQEFRTLMSPKPKWRITVELGFKPTQVIGGWLSLQAHTLTDADVERVQ